MKKAIKHLRKKKGKKRSETFDIYIYRVLKKIHPNIGISKKSMGIMNSFVNDVFERICLEASKLVKNKAKKVLKVWDIYTSVKLILNGELRKFAISERTKVMICNSKT